MGKILTMDRDSQKFDEHDHKLLKLLQVDASQPVEAVAAQIGLSRNAAWRRIRRLEEIGAIRARVALLDADVLGVGLSVFIAVRTGHHDAKTAEAFSRAVARHPEITGVYRTSGDLDYLLHARVRDVRDYDKLYKSLIAEVELKDISASFVMEEIKETTEIPVG
jgi:Lrp/AsnC family transcriptional regulator